MYTRVIANPDGSAVFLGDNRGMYINSKGKLVTNITYKEEFELYESDFTVYKGKLLFTLQKDDVYNVYEYKNGKRELLYKDDTGTQYFDWVGSKLYLLDYSEYSTVYYSIK